MRVGIFAWESLHSIPVGGVAVHATELAAALRRRGHEVHVFTRLAQGQQPYECIHDVHYHRCAFPLRPSFVDETDDMCRAFVREAWAVEDFVGPFDVLHAHDWMTANAAVWAREGRGRRTILTMHSTEYGRNGNRFFGGAADRISGHERHGTYCASHVITVSNKLKDEVRWLYQLPDEKVSVIYNGVNAAAFDCDVDPGEIKSQYAIGPLDPMVLFVGRLVVQKGPDVLVRAIPSILRYYPSTKFVFVGDGHMRSELYMTAHNMGVAHAIRMLGHKSGQELVNLYKACDVVCVPSHNEPFGIVILEAWSAGKPVVTTRRGGPQEFVWHDINGLQIDDTQDSVAWGLGTLLANHEHCRWMGRNGRAAVDAVFSWDSIAQQTEEVYASVV